MYACFTMKRAPRNWDVEEIKFLNDSVKVLQSIMMKRIQQNSLAESYTALEEVLNNIGSYIYVKDKETGRILFANRCLRNNFREEIEQNSLESVFESRIPKDSRKAVWKFLRRIMTAGTMFFIRISSGWTAETYSCVPSTM